MRLTIEVDYRGQKYTTEAYLDPNMEKSLREAIFQQTQPGTRLLQFAMIGAEAFCDFDNCGQEVPCPTAHAA